MSHFTVLVIGENPEEQLEPFNENTEVKPYVKYTKQELIQHERKNLEEYRKTIYAEFLKDKEAYIKKCRKPEHIKYLKETFPKLLGYSDEHLYKYAKSHYRPDMIGDDGEIYSTYNPKSKWDWYVLGGRWAGYFTLKLGPRADAALKKHIKMPIPPTFAVLKNGEWHEKGQMG